MLINNRYHFVWSLILVCLLPFILRVIISNYFIKLNTFWFLRSLLQSVGIWFGLIICLMMLGLLMENNILLWNRKSLSLFYHFLIILLGTLVLFVRIETVSLESLAFMCFRNMIITFLLFSFNFFAKRNWLLIRLYWLRFRKNCLSLFYFPSHLSRSIGTGRHWLRDCIIIYNDRLLSWPRVSQYRLNWLCFIQTLLLNGRVWFHFPFHLHRFSAWL